LTGDDEGRKSGDEEWRPRARQNVVLELGFFIGALGRGRVALLYEEEVELPSDIAGVLYLPLDDAGAWKAKLAREMSDAGVAVDANKVLRA
jgi:predicted nucleotide-binding protein